MLEDQYLNSFRSSQTRRSYKWMLDKIFSYCLTNKIELLEFNGDLFENFLESQEAWGDNSKYLAYCAAKSYLRWLFGNSSPLASFHLRRVRPRPQRTLTVKQATELLTSLDTSTDYGRRNLAMIVLMLNCGLRSFEVTGALLKNLDLTNRSLQVLVKGGSWRTAKFTQYTAACIASWLGVRSEWAKRVATAQTIFISRKGKRLATNGVRKLFSRLAGKSGLDALSPHDLRRTFATISTQAGAPPRIIMAAGGWSDMGSLLRYTQAVSPDDLEPFNPIDFIMGHLN